MKLTGTINPPEKPLNIPVTAQWLGGQGIGGWFYLEPTLDMKEFRIARYSPEGTKECDRIFTLISENNFDITLKYSFTYISHCGACNITQNGINYRFVFKAS